jgi:hypothetical protein
MHSSRKAWLALAACLSSGCWNYSTTRLPFIASRGVEVERRRDQVQDPFPDADQGPYVGFRPLQFNRQRTEVQRARDRAYSGFMRGQYTAQVPVPPPGQAPVFVNAIPEQVR